MRSVHYQNQPVKGTLTIPGDKSISHRAIMLGAIAKGETTIHGFLNGEDCLRTIEIFRQLGVSIQQNDTTVKIQSPGMQHWTTPTSDLYCGNSGTTARLMLGILAGSSIKATLTGDASLSKRPMDRVVHPLTKMGAKIESDTSTWTLPLKVTGKPLKGIHYKSPVASAQVKSAILFAGLNAEGETSVEENAISRDHTERMLKDFEAHVESHSKTVTIKKCLPFTGRHIDVPGDISSAAFFLVAAALVEGSALTLKNVGLNQTRTGVIDVLLSMGADLRIFDEKTINGELVGSIHLVYTPLQGIVIEGELIPRLIDELPIIALLATQANGKTTIRNAEELRVKETDRIAAVTNELSKIGAQIEGTADGMVIHGPTPLKGGKMDSYGDHRLGMMAGIAALISTDPIDIQDESCIDISYPTFFDHLDKVTK